MKKERFAFALILLAFFSGMVLTAATSGCDSNNGLTAQNPTSLPEAGLAVHLNSAN